MTQVIRLTIVALLALVAWKGMATAQDGRGENYRLAPGDVVTIVVLGEEALSGEHLIGPDGTLRLPLIGPIEAAGLTLDELTERLTQALKRFLRNPQVSVALKQLPPMFRRVYVLGAVKTPGAYAIPAGVSPTIFDAIALAGGFAEDADLERIRVVRKDGQALTFNMRHWSSNGFRPDGVVIQPGDLVWVPPAFVHVSVAGAVNTPGYYPVPTQATLLDLLARAGGVKDPSAVIRLYRSGVEILSVPWAQLNEGKMATPITLQDGDTVLATVREVTGIAVTGVGVQKPGVFNVVGRVTVLGALAMAGAAPESSRPLRVRVLRDGKEVTQVQWSASTPVQELSMELQSGDLVVVEPMVIRVTVVGSVQKPGSYELPAGARVTDLLAKAEGVQPTADLSNAVLVRKGESRTVDLLQLFWDARLDNDVELQDGDVVLLPMARKVWVTGAVQKPGAVDYQPRMTVVDAISAAGGVRDTEEADLSAVRLVSGGETRVLNLESAFRGATMPMEMVKPGDVIIVPERSKAYVFGAVARPGAVRVQTGDNAITLLSAAGGPSQEARLSDAALVRLVNGKPVVMRLNLDKAIKEGDPKQAPPVQAGDILYIPSQRRSPLDNVTRALNLVTTFATVLLYFLR